MLVAPPLPEVTMKNVTRSCHMPPPNDTSLSTLKWTQIVFMHRGTDRQLKTTLKALGMEDHSLGLAWAIFQLWTQDFVTLFSTTRMMACVHWASAFSRHRATVCTPCAHCYHARGRKRLPFILPPHTHTHLGIYLLASPLQTWINAEWA